MAWFARQSHFTRLLLRLKLWFYLSLTREGRIDRGEAHIRWFRLGIPLVLKVTHRTFSTEADALRFLNSTVPHLPIPRLVDSFQLDGITYTIMTKLPGEPLLSLHNPTPAELQPIVDDILAILDDLWRVPQPPELGNKLKVMISASGHGLKHPATFHEQFGGPYDSTYELYRSLVWDDLSKQSRAFLQPILEDPIVYIPEDIAMQNILIRNGRVSGIIDWEDAGWFPRHWIVHKLRTPRPGCEGFWLRYWKFTHRFDPVMEDAYDTGLCEDMLVYRI